MFVRLSNISLPWNLIRNLIITNERNGYIYIYIQIEYVTFINKKNGFSDAGDG